MSIILQGIQIDEFYSQIKNCIKQEIENALSEQKRNISPPTSILLTRKETAQKLGISLVTLHDWCAKGIIQFYRINTRIRFKEEEIEKLLSQPAKHTTR